MNDHPTNDARLRHIDTSDVSIDGKDYFEGGCPEFGIEIRAREFQLRQGSTFLNHGSYGTVPKRLRDRQARFLAEMESHPDDWFRRKEFGYWRKAQAAIAKFLGSSENDIVFVKNATTGINTVLSSYPWEDGDGLLATSLTYPAVIKTCICTREHTKGLSFHNVDIEFPIDSEDEFVSLYEKELDRHPDIKVAVIDHITSATGLLIPIKRLIELCHKRGIIAVIDGAHGPGHLPLNLQELGADIYTGNLHKWLFSPKSCAVLWVSPKHQSWIRPLVTSHFYGMSFTYSFYKEGTSDFTPYTCVPEALNFYNGLGGIDKIIGYNSSILDKVVEQLVESWKTNKLPIPKSMETPCLRVIRLPELPGYSKTKEGAYALHTDLFEKFDTQTTVELLNNDLHVRLSAQVYNSVEDYTKLDTAIHSLMK